MYTFFGNGIDAIIQGRQINCKQLLNIYIAIINLSDRYNHYSLFDEWLSNPKNNISLIVNNMRPILSLL